MRLRLKKLRFCNFLIFGNQWTEIDLISHPTTLVIGKNGCGKSAAFMDAISFALFNKPFRNINKPIIANTITRQPCIVELEFEANGHELAVRRGTRPNLFEIYKNDILITEASNVRDYQEDFEKNILRCNHKTFCQIVMLGSAIFVPFMKLPAAARRNVIEDLLDLKIFSTMNTLLKKRIEDSEMEIYRKQQQKKSLAEKIELTEQHLKELYESNEQLIAEKQKNLLDTQSKIDNLNKDIQTFTDKLIPLTTSTGNWEILQKRMKEITKINHQLQHKMQMIDKDIDFFQDNENCPTCQQTIDENFKLKTISTKNKEQQEVNEAINKLAKRINETQTQIDDITAIQKEITQNTTMIRGFQNEISFHESNKRNIQKEIDQLQTKKKEIDTSQLSNWKDELLETETILNNNHDDHQIMEVASEFLKDGGIKSRIIKTYVPKINQLIQKYLAALDLFIEFRLDEQFNETIHSRFRDSFIYNSFSEGQKARIDLALLFTFRALAKLRGSVDCNLLIFDEVLESAIDSEGIENMLKLISNLTNNENIVIMSHREGISEDKFSRVLKFSMNKNFSQMIEQ